MQGLPLLSSSSSETSALASTPRDHARCGLRGERLGEADHPGPEMERMLGRVDVRGVIADAGADGPAGRLLWDRVTRDIFPLPRFALSLPLCVNLRTLQQRQRRTSRQQNLPVTMVSEIPF